MSESIIPSLISPEPPLCSVLSGSGVLPHRTMRISGDLFMRVSQSENGRVMPASPGLAATMSAYSDAHLRIMFLLVIRVKPSSAYGFSPSSSRFFSSCACSISRFSMFKRYCSSARICSLKDLPAIMFVGNERLKGMTRKGSTA